MQKLNIHLTKRVVIKYALLEEDSICNIQRNLTALIFMKIRLVNLKYSMYNEEGELSPELKWFVVQPQK